MAKAEKKDKVSVSPEQRLQVRRESFLRVVTPRVNKAVKSIHLVGNCAGAGYSYTPEQSKAVVLALQVAVQGVENAYNKKVEATKEFQLPA